MKYENLGEVKRIFIDTYIATMNIKRSSEAAGITEFKGWEYLQRGEIQELISERMREKIGATPRLTKDRVVQELLRIATFDPLRMFHPDGTPKDLDQIDEDTRRCIIDISFYMEKGGPKKGTTVKQYKMADKLKALDSLGKVLAIFVEKHEHVIKRSIEDLKDVELDDALEQFAAKAGIRISTGAESETQH